MKFSNKLSLTVFLTSVIILALALFIDFKFGYENTVETGRLNTQFLATHVSSDIDILLTEKVETAVTLGNIPTLTEALNKSNQSFASLSRDQRKHLIQTEDEKWKSISDPTNNFILKFTDNPVSQVFKNQQILFEGNYGEIFLTNKFGALIASTAKLSTYAHGHKYWWLGAHNQGDGAVFIDYRGYDDSVRGYVIGIVVPIRDGDEVIGILKCNLNIIGDLSASLLEITEHVPGEYRLVRSGGLVVVANGVEPLSTRITETAQKKIMLNHSGSFIDHNSENIFGYAAVSLSKEDGKYNFGGTFESIDHKKGNLGESWYIICTRPFEEVLAPLYASYLSTLKVGFSIIIILVIVSYIYGKTISKPLTLINAATIKVRGGDFGSRVELKSKDEFGSLADHFNIMVDKIGHMNQTLTDHNVNLENRVEKRTIALSNSNQKLQDEIIDKMRVEQELVEADSINELLLDIITHDLKNPIGTIYSLSHKAMEENPDNKMIGVIHLGSKELLTQLENASILSRATLGETIPLEELNLLKILKEVIEEFNLDIQNAHIILTMDVPADITITANPLIAQIFKNYISNAIRYANKGKAIHIQTLRKKDSIVVEINDLGDTIPEKDRARIFERRIQITKDKRRGQGLGLAIVKRIALAHGAQVWVEPNQPKGNKFCLRLPV